MLNLGIANSLLKSVSEYVDRNVKIMDADGMIVACLDKSSRGIVDAVAHELMESDEEMTAVHADSGGADAGVYLPLVVNRNKVGVLAVEGDGEDVTATAQILKICIEKSLELDLMRRDSELAFVSDEQYIHQLIYNPRIPKSDLDYLVRISHIQSEIPRVPILMVLHIDGGGPKIDANRVLNAIYRSSVYNTSDLLGRTLDDNIIWFKSIDPARKLEFMAMHESLAEEITGSIASIDENICLSAYVGAVQEKLQNYAVAYRQCEWMRLDICERGIYFFYDYILRYLGSKISKLEYETMFAALRNGMDHAALANFTEMMDALIQCDYNFGRVSEKLYVHKNTAIYRFDKIRNQFSINPLTNSNERTFLETLYNYIRAYPQAPES